MTDSWNTHQLRKALMMNAPAMNSRLLFNGAVDDTARWLYAAVTTVWKCMLTDTLCTA
jgi:hypothetical protein